MDTVMNILFFGGLVGYLIATLLQFSSSIFKKAALKKASWITALLGFGLNTAYIVVRGIIAGRLPLSNQFEFATAFAWGIALIYIILHVKLKAEWISSITLPIAFLMISYAALLPKEISELMPALRSAWFGLHIGAAVFSYASFAIAGCIGLKYILTLRKGEKEDNPHLVQMDFLSYRFIALGFLLLTVVILSGCIWAEQAWSAFWTWDPKETWALITWIMYAIYLHLRIRKKWQGKRMAWFSMIAVACVVFTFIGVNQLLPGLHSYT